MNKKLEVQFTEDRKPEIKEEFIERLTETAERIYLDAIARQIIQGKVSEYNEIKRNVFNIYR